MKKTLALATILSFSVATSAFAMDGEFITKMVDKHIAMMDTNNDGMISKDEHAAASVKMFNEADTNHDGMLSKQEIMDMKTKEMAKVDSSVKMDSEKMSKMVDYHMTMMDSNHDGMISKDEHAAASEKMFAKADTNNDGMVSRQEMIDMKVKEMNKMEDTDGVVKKNGTNDSNK